MKTRKPKRTSMRRVTLTGEPAPSWTPDAELSALANKCYIACLSPYAKPDLIRVFWNNSTAAFGRCWYDQRIITIKRGHKGWLHTLAHEIAHLKYQSHGVRHNEITEMLYAWLVAETGEV